MLGVKDLDKYLLEKVDDRSLINLCKTNVGFHKLCADEQFWKKRAEQKFYSDFLKYKIKDMKWKDFYLKCIYVSCKKLIYFTFKRSARPGHRISVGAVDYLQKIMEPLYEKINNINIENIHRELFEILGGKELIFKSVTEKEEYRTSLDSLALESLFISDPKNFYYKPYDKRRIIEYILQEIIESSIDNDKDILTSKNIKRSIETEEFYFLKMNV
jgi:hypothetical protein